MTLTLCNLLQLLCNIILFKMCLDEEDRVWFMLHSGSRGPGNRIGTVYIELAKNDMLKLDKQVKV